MFVLTAPQCFFAALAFSLAGLALAALVSRTMRRKIRSRPVLAAGLVLVLALAAVASGKPPVTPPETPPVKLKMLVRSSVSTNRQESVMRPLDFEVRIVE